MRVRRYGNEEVGIRPARAPDLACRHTALLLPDVACHHRLVERTREAECVVRYPKREKSRVLVIQAPFRRKRQELPVSDLRQGRGLLSRGADLLRHQPHHRRTTRKQSRAGRVANITVAGADEAGTKLEQFWTRVQS